MSEPIAVDVGACRCDGKPHDSDVVYLEPELTLPMASGAMYALNYETDGTTSALMRLLTEAYLPAGIRSWTFVDAQGGSIPVNRENMERLVPFDHGGMEVSEKADALYAERLMTPLLRRRLKSSPRGRTARPTSPIPISGRKRPTRSAPSSDADGASRRSAG